MQYEYCSHLLGERNKNKLMKGGMYMIAPTKTPMQKSTERKEKMTTEKTLSLVRMSDVQLQEVK